MIFYLGQNRRDKAGRTILATPPQKKTTKKQQKKTVFMLKKPER